MPSLNNLYFTYKVLSRVSNRNSVAHNNAQQCTTAASFCALGCVQYSHFCALICNIYCMKTLHSEYKFCSIALLHFCIIALLHIGTVKYPFKEPVGPLPVPATSTESVGEGVFGCRPVLY